jgi:hypothetical protein
MNMTPEQQAQWKDACNAMRDGEQIQVQLLSGEWADTAIFDPRLPHRRKPKPGLWTLPPPPDGQQWHRTDWTEDMLPEGWRPLLKGEAYKNGDEYKVYSEWRVETNVSSYQTTDYCHFPTRTMRPLPTPPRMVPLGFCDVPPGSCLSTTSGRGSWWQVLWAGNYLIVAELGRLEYEYLQTNGFQIHRPGDNDADGKPVFRKCEKEETK